MHTCCPWAKTALDLEYHDHEWGKPVCDDRLLFEFLVLETAQAGLSWATILKKREGYRQAFHHFDILKVAQMNDQDIERLLQNPGIVRNPKKIHAAIDNARMVEKIQSHYGSLASFMWSFVEGKPIQNTYSSVKDIPAQTPLSQKLSKALKKCGGKFIGPTVCYAFMQATGMVNDHLIDCPQHQKCAELGKHFSLN